MANKKFTNDSTNFIEMFHGDFISVRANMQTNSYGIYINCCIINNSNDKSIAEFEWGNHFISVDHKGNVYNEILNNDNKIFHEIKEFFNSLGFKHSCDFYSKGTNLTYIMFKKENE